MDTSSTSASKNLSTTTPKRREEGREEGREGRREGVTLWGRGGREGERYLVNIREEDFRHSTSPYKDRFS
jgi:hypothetical protein